MLAIKALPTKAEIEKVFSFDPDTGVFKRKHGKGGAFSATSKSGNYYRKLKVNGRRYYAHRIAWLLIHGSEPPAVIDHINGNKRDNRACNLRAVTQAENMRNISLRSDSSTGVKGVQRNPRTGNYYARIKVRGVVRLLGTFKTTSEASAAYEAAAAEMHGAFAHHLSRS